jgi:cell division protein FtsI (penicillin-binding protein 3)
MNKAYKVRTVFVFIFSCLLYALALFNLFSLQIKQNSFFKDLGMKQYYTTVITSPPRALIKDRNGQPLALNKDSITAFILPRTIKHPEKLKRFLKKNFPHALARWKRRGEAHFLYVKRKLTKEEEDLIKDHGIEDIQFLTEPSRFYPLSSAGSLTGITNTDNMGLFGMELNFNEILSGTPTTSILEKDARSGRFYFSKKTEQEGTNGKPVTLTIDGDLQFLVHEELMAQINKYNAKEGAALVMNPETGEILAMSSYPTFDPNDTRALQMVTTKNTAVTESYEFGSALKAFTALAALEEGLVTAQEEIDCLSAKTAYVDGRKINTWEAKGIMTFEDIIARSNNIGIAKVAKRLDTKLYDHYTKIGFGSRTGISFPGEQSGFVQHPKNWSKQSIISLSYGYEITTTLLGLATAFSIFSNGGKRIYPKLILEPEQYTKQPVQLYSEESVDAMRTILEKTTSKKGTARYATVHGYKTMGKTSTANLLENGVYNEHKNLYGFAGIVEKDSYKRVIACFLRESPRKNLYASTVAAPLFERIAEKTLLHDKIIA